MSDYELRNIVFMITNIMFVYSIYMVFKECFGLSETKKRWIAFCYIAFYLVNSLLFLAGCNEFIIFGAFVGMLSLCLTICHPGKVWMKILTGVIVVTYSLMIEMISGYLLAFFLHLSLDEVLKQVRYETIVIVLAKLLLLLSALGLSMKKGSYRIKKIPFHYLGMFLLVPICSILLVMCIFLKESETSRNIANIITCISVILMFIMNLGVYYLIHQICMEYDRKISVHELQYQLQMYSENNEIQKAFIVEMEKYRHDVKNFYIRLGNYLKRGLSEKAMEELQRESEVIRQIINIIDTGNPEFDYLMNHKMSYALSKGVCIQPSIRIAEPIVLEINDIYNLLGNILDNAIEATELLEDKVPVELRIDSSQNMLYICACNSFSGERIRSETGFHSTKKNTKGHGYGLKKIKEITKKYDGKMMTEVKDDKFRLDVIITYQT